MQVKQVQLQAIYYNKEFTLTLIGVVVFKHIAWTPGLAGVVIQVEPAQTARAIVLIRIDAG